MTNIQKIIDEFEENFYQGEGNSLFCKKHKIYATPFEVKFFLNKALNQIRQETLEEVEREIKKIKYPPRELPFDEEKYEHGYNQAISEIENFIQSKKENI